MAILAPIMAIIWPSFGTDYPGSAGRALATLLWSRVAAGPVKVRKVAIMVNTRTQYQF